MARRSAVRARVAQKDLLRAAAAEHHALACVEAVVRCLGEYADHGMDAFTVAFWVVLTRNAVEESQCP